jgi:hypothetical protein
MRKVVGDEDEPLVGLRVVVDDAPHWLGEQHVKKAYLDHCAVGNVDKLRNAAAKIQKRVHLDGSLRLAKSRPHEQGQTKIDGRRIEIVLPNSSRYRPILVRTQRYKTGCKNIMTQHRDSSVFSTAILTKVALLGAFTPARYAPVFQQRKIVDNGITLRAYVGEKASPHLAAVS